jgi:hypothetical protein
VTRYAFNEVREALRDHWGLSLHRGSSDRADGDHDGRWAVEYSRTGYVVGGDLPRRGHGYQRFRSLSDVVRVWDLDKVVARSRR